MACFSEDGGMPFGDDEWDMEAVPELDLAAAEAEAAALGLLDDGEHLASLPIAADTSDVSMAADPVTPPRKSCPQVLETSIEKRVAPAGAGDSNRRKRLCGKQTLPATTSPPVSEGILIDGKTVKQHPLFVRYWKMDAAARRLASKRLSQQKYRVLNDLVQYGSIELFGDTIAYSGDKTEAASLVEHKFFLAVAKDTAKCAADRGYALSQLAQYERSNDLGSLDTNKTPTIRNVPSALLTYIGADGLVDIKTVVLPPTSTASSSDGPTVEERFRILRGMDVDDVAALLKSSKKVVEFFGQLETQVVNAVNRLHTPHWAITVELCAKSLASSDVLRIHGHVWIAHKGQTLELSSIAIGDGKCVPYANWTALRFLSGMSERSAASAMAGAFYCTIAKRGTITQKSTCLPWQDFSVRDAWTTNVYASVKISYEVARAAYIRTVHKASSNVAQLEYCHKERRKAALQSRMLRIEQELRETLLPWKAVPAVQEWQLQYAEKRGRYSFLVLDGESCFGETKYALSLFAAWPHVLL